MIYLRIIILLSIFTTMSCGQKINDNKIEYKQKGSTEDNQDTATSLDNISSDVTPTENIPTESFTNSEIKCEENTGEGNLSCDTSTSVVTLHFGYGKPWISKKIYASTYVDVQVLLKTAVQDQTDKTNQRKCEHIQWPYEKLDFTLELVGAEKGSKSNSTSEHTLTDLQRGKVSSIYRFYPPDNENSFQLRTVGNAEWDITSNSCLECRKKYPPPGSCSECNVPKFPVPEHQCISFKIGIATDYTSDLKGTL